MSGESQELADIVNEALPEVSEPVVNEPAPAPAEHEPTPEPTPVEGEEVPAEAAYTPNFDYTVQGETKQMDERFHPLVKDADSEQYVRNVLQRSEGLSHVEASRDKFKGQYDDVNSQHTSLNKELDTLNHYIRTGNMQKFFETLEIPESQVLRYAQQRLEYRDMSPEQKNVYDQHLNGQANNYDLYQQNQDLLAQRDQGLIDSRDGEVMNQLNQPEVAEIANAYDDRIGKPGAFYEEVWNRGRMHAMVDGSNISAKQAVDEVLQMVGGLPPSQGDQGLPGVQTLGSPTPGAPIPTQKPVIPRIEGSGASPTRPVISSIQGIRDARKEKFGG